MVLGHLFIDFCLRKVLGYTFRSYLLFKLDFYSPLKTHASEAVDLLDKYDGFVDHSKHFKTS